MDAQKQIYGYNFHSWVPEQDFRGDGYGSASAPNVSALAVEKGYEEGEEILTHDMEITQLLWTMNNC